MGGTSVAEPAKSGDKNSKYAYGSERKASRAIVHIGFRTMGEPLSRGERLVPGALRTLTIGAVTRSE